MSDKFKSTIYLDDVPFEVECFFYPGESRSYWEFGCPESVEIDSISFTGVKFNEEQMNLFIESYGEKELDEWMLEEAYNNLRSKCDDRADFLYEEWKERKLGII